MLAGCNDQQTGERKRMCACVCVVLLDVAKFLSTATCYIFIENYRLLLAKREKKEEEKGKALECFFRGCLTRGDFDFEIYLLKAERFSFFRVKENEEIKKRRREKKKKKRTNVTVPAERKKT